MSTLTDAEFGRFQRFIYDAAGISLSPAKKAMVSGRLSKRLRELQLDTFMAYIELLDSGKAAREVQFAVDLLTTNETYFFREPKHFDLLGRVADEATGRAQPFRVWSAACSTGEECYSIAMVLADRLGESSWEVVGSDISARVVQRARFGHYPLSRAQHVPTAYMKRFCLKGTGEQEGTLLVDRELRKRVNFSLINLNTDLPRMGLFDVIFLRNVMIYFNGDTKRQVVARVLSMLRPGGYFCIGHSESLHEINTTVDQIAPSIYRKV
jgi:chemotaxis protein methyltransferase CheR